MYKSLTIFVLSTLLLAGCGKAAAPELCDDNLFDYSKPVDLTQIQQAYEWYQGYDGEDWESILYTKIDPDLPEDEFYLFEDTSFVLRVPEYNDSQQPFLANAENFYNSCALAWNVWSNHEVWYRGHTADLLRSDNDVRKSIKAVSVSIIKDADVRKAAEDFEQSLLQMMDGEPDECSEDGTTMDLLLSYSDVIVSKAYRFYDDEEVFVHSLDSVMDIAEGKAMDKFQHYLDADEEDQLEVILEELASCQSFDEQCSLWRNWANCEKSVIEDEWLVAVGAALMDSGNYSPVLHRLWITWRALCQTTHYGMSRDSAIPNQYYNEYRKKCYMACLKRIDRHPDDVYAMNCAAAIGGRTNMNRFGQNYFGNEAMIESVMMMPKRYNFNDSEEDEGYD